MKSKPKTTRTTDAVATCTIGAKGLALNDACNTNAECESGLYYYFELGYDIPYGVCTKACTAPATKAEENCPTTMTCEKQGTDKLYCTPKSDAQGNALVGPGNGSMDRYEPCWENPDCDSKLCYYIPNSATSFCSLDCSKDATICGTCGSCVETTDSDNKTVHVCVPQGKTAHRRGLRLRTGLRLRHLLRRRHQLLLGPLRHRQDRRLPDRLGLQEDGEGHQLLPEDPRTPTPPSAKPAPRATSARRAFA